MASKLHPAVGTSVFADPLPQPGTPLLTPADIAEALSEAPVLLASIMPAAAPGHDRPQANEPTAEPTLDALPTLAPRL